MLKPTASPSRYRRQAGGIAVFVAIGLSVLVSLLALLDIGFMYHYKREYQKAADLAAIAAVGQLSAACSETTDIAVAAVGANLNIQWDEAYLRGEGLVCGQWNGLDVVAAGDAIPNAVQVTVRGWPPRFLMPERRRISAVATASSQDPVAAFSVGTRLLRLSDNSAVGDLLESLGVDSAAINLLGYEGLATVTVTPGQLLSRLGVPVSLDMTLSDFNHLLSTEVRTLEEFMDATVNVAGRAELLALNTEVLASLQAALSVSGASDLHVPLGSLPGRNGLFSPAQSSVAAALDVSVNALELLNTAIVVASAKRGIEVESSHLELPGLGGISLRIGVVEPPSIGLGGVGAQAYSAQLRLAADLAINPDQVAGSLLNALSTTISLDIPMIVDLASAEGTVRDLCTETLRAENGEYCPVGADCADIDVQTQAAQICIGSIANDEVFSNSQSCADLVNDDATVFVRVAGMTLINKTGLGTPHIVVSTAREASLLAAGQAETVGGSIQLDDMAHQLTDAVIAAILSDTVSRDASMSAQERERVAEELWESSGGSECDNDQAWCRRSAMSAAIASMEGSIGSLSHFMTVVNGRDGLIGSVLTLDIEGILGGLGQLLGRLSGLTGIFDECTSDGFGTRNGCLDQLEAALDQQHSSGDVLIRSGNVFLASLLLPVLQDILSSLGHEVLQPLFENVLGLQIGEADINMMGLQCHENAHLVQ